MSMPFSCDTMVALPDVTEGGQTLFAKNSDRSAEESQPLVHLEAAQHGPGSTVRTQFVELPQAAATYAHVGSRPYWCWGYEHGFNEHQVVIGNEGLRSKFDVSSEARLIGMELIRLGLERGRTAAEAVDVITGLVSEHGQGRFTNDGDVKTYDNGYIVADGREAYIVETADREWAVKRVESSVGIGNLYSIGTDWDTLSADAERRALEAGWWVEGRGRFDFGGAYGDPPEKPTGRSEQRRARSCAVLRTRKGDISARTMMSLVSDHSTGDRPEEEFVREVGDNPSLCVHYGHSGSGGTTTASLVADLCADGSRLPIYWCSMYSPCLGVFLPTFIEGRVPPVLSVGDANPSDDSPWWLFRTLEASARRDGLLDAGEVAALRSAWAGLQAELLESAYQVAAEGRRLIDEGRGDTASTMLTGFMTSNTERALAIARELLAERQSVAPATAG